MARPKLNRWADESIGHACAQLMHWGYPGSQVFAAVAAAANRAFGREVGPDRVKQIYRDWAEQERPFGYRDPGAFTRAERTRQRPEGSLHDLAERLLRDHGPEWVQWRDQQRARRVEALVEVARRAAQIDLLVSTPGPDPLDDEKWVTIGGGTHPDAMTPEQRAAFAALPRHDQERYRRLVKNGARKRWEQYEPYLDQAFDRLRETLATGVYAPPGVGLDIESTPRRGRRRRKIG